MSTCTAQHALSPYSRRGAFRCPPGAVCHRCLPHDVVNEMAMIERQNLCQVSEIHSAGYAFCNHVIDYSRETAYDSRACSRCPLRFSLSTPENRFTAPQKSFEECYLDLYRRFTSLPQEFGDATQIALFYLRAAEDKMYHVSKITDLGKDKTGCCEHDYRYFMEGDDVAGAKCARCEFAVRYAPTSAVVYNGSEDPLGRTERLLALLVDAKFPVVCLTERKEFKVDPDAELKTHLYQIEIMTGQEIQVLIKIGSFGCDHRRCRSDWTDYHDPEKKDYASYHCRDCDFEFRRDFSIREYKDHCHGPWAVKEARYVAAIADFRRRASERAAAPPPLHAAAADPAVKTVVKGKRSRSPERV